MKKQNILKYATIYTLGYISVFPLILLIFFYLNDKNGKIRHGMADFAHSMKNFLKSGSTVESFVDITFLTSFFLSLVIVLAGGIFIRYLLNKKQNPCKTLNNIIIHTFAYTVSFPVSLEIFVSLSSKDDKTRPVILSLAHWIAHYYGNNFEMYFTDDVVADLTFVAACLISVIAVFTGNLFIKHLKKKKIDVILIDKLCRKNTLFSRILDRKNDIKENIAIFIMGYISIFPFLYFIFIYTSKKSKKFYYLMLPLSKKIENFFELKNAPEHIFFSTLISSCLVSVILAIIFRKLFMKLYNKKQT